MLLHLQLCCLITQANLINRFSLRVDTIEIIDGSNSSEKIKDINMGY